MKNDRIFFNDRNETGKNEIPFLSQDLSKY